MFRASGDDRAWAWHLSISNCGGSRQLVRDRANKKQDVGVSRRSYLTQASVLEIQTGHLRDNRVGHDEGSQVARDYAGHQPVQPGHGTGTGATYCRFRPPSLHA